MRVCVRSQLTKLINHINEKIYEDINHIQFIMPFQDPHTENWWDCGTYKPKAYPIY